MTFICSKVEGLENTYDGIMNGEVDGDGRIDSLDERKDFDKFCFYLETTFQLFTRN